MEMSLLERFAVSHIVGSRFIQIWGMDAGNKITWGKKSCATMRGFEVLNMKLVKGGEDGERES